MKYILFSILLISGAVIAQEFDPKKGKALSATCVACHGIDGNSMAPTFPKIAGQGQEYIYKQLKDYKVGNRNNALMAGIVASLSDEDMKHLAAYYSSQTTSPNVATEDTEMLALGKKIYLGGKKETKVAACIACHGARGLGIPSAKFPKVSHQHASYTESQLKMFRQHSLNIQMNDNKPERANDYEAMMRNVAQSLTDDEIKALAQYISGLH